MFALLSDAPSWARWAGPAVPAAQWESETPTGVGAVRLVGRGRLTVREQVVVHEPGRAFSYVLLSGGRVHGYRADVVLDRTEKGTDLRWTGTVTSPVPGLASALLPGFHLLVGGFATRLVAAAQTP